jgi:PHD/YefM family antitoxin component YafN of YafNO toxin-antitoxin module
MVVGDPAFDSLDVTQLRRAMDKIHEQVAAAHGRIELTRPGCDDVCVILSKTELQSLERALEILAETTEYKSMCDQVARLVTECDGVHCAEHV